MAFGDFTVTRASTKNVLGSAGLYVSVANNVPAFEFNTDGSYRGLLVEPGATNTVRNNSMVGAVAGSPGTLPTFYGTVLQGLTREIIGTGTELGVDYIDIKFSGTATSTGIVEVQVDGANGTTALTGQAWTISSFIKVIAQPTPPNSYSLNIYELTGAGGFVTVKTGTFTPSTTVFERRSFATTLTGGGTVGRARPVVGFSVTNGASYDFTIRIGWPQLETGSVSTSPIVTTAGTASRVADSVVLTSASSVIGQSAGTLYAEIEPRIVDGTRRVLTLSDNTAGNRILMFLHSTSRPRYLVTTGGVGQIDLQPAGSLTGITKLACAYALNDFAIYSNGSSLATSTSGTIPATSQVTIGQLETIGTAHFNGWIRSVALFPTRLADATLATLTTL
jgi:hypothetical protein